MLKFKSIQPQPLSLLTPVSILSTGSTFKQLEQALQYISSTGSTFKQLEQAVQCISSTGSTLEHLEQAVLSTYTDFIVNKAKQLQERF